MSEKYNKFYCGIPTIINIETNQTPNKQDAYPNRGKKPISFFSAIYEDPINFNTNKSKNLSNKKDLFALYQHLQEDPQKPLIEETELRKREALLTLDELSNQYIYNKMCKQLEQDTFITIISKISKNFFKEYETLSSRNQIRTNPINLEYQTFINAMQTTNIKKNQRKQITQSIENLL